MSRNSLLETGAPLLKKEFLDTEATIECGFTLKRIYDMIRTYSQMHHANKYSQQSSIIWPVWLNGRVFLCELSGCGFESRCSHLNFFNVLAFPLSILRKNLIKLKKFKVFALPLYILQKEFMVVAFQFYTPKNLKSLYFEKFLFFWQTLKILNVLTFQFLFKNQERLSTFLKIL